MRSASSERVRRRRGPVEEARVAGELVGEALGAHRRSVQLDEPVVEAHVPVRRALAVGQQRLGDQQLRTPLAAWAAERVGDLVVPGEEGACSCCRR